LKKQPLYNRAKAPNIRTVTISELGGGMNEVFAPLNIKDGQIAKCRNFYTPDGVTLATVPCDAFSNPYPLSASEDDRGFASFNGVGSGVLPLMYTSADGTNYIASVIQGASGTVYDVSTHAFTVSETLETRGAVEFITQAERYSIYWSTDENFIIVQAQTSRTVTTVTLPSGVYPRNMVSHRTRLYLLDTHNTIWWCNAGDYTTWYGETPTEEYQAIDAGYWFVDAGQTLNQIVSFGENLYIFGDTVIYQFSGYSDSTFSLNRLFNGLGTYPYYERSITVSGDLMYFTFKNRVYEYDGSSYPSMISEPEIRNGDIVNGIAGGIDPTIWDGAGGLYEADWEYRSVVATKDKVYLYSRYTTFKTVYASGKYYTFIPTYVFDIKHRSWWMQDFAFYDMGSTTSGAGRLTIIPAVGTDGTITIAKTLKRIIATNAQESSIANICFIQTSRNGTSTTTVHSSDYYCWFESKAFSTLIDSKFKIYEVDVVWRYTGTLGDKKTYMQLGWDVDADVSRTASPSYAGRYITGSEDQSDSFQIYQNGEWDSDWHSIEYGTEYGVAYQDTWQVVPQVAKWRVDQYSEEFRITPFMRLVFLCQFNPIEILRIELKYREIGASR